MNARVASSPTTRSRHSRRICDRDGGPRDPASRGPHTWRIPKAQPVAFGPSALRVAPDPAKSGTVICPNSIQHPILLPDGHIQIAFSGGRSSAFMLHQLLQANGDLPSRVEVTFQNTGREMPQTLDFVAECGRRWGVMIAWLEYRPEHPFFDIIGRQGASTNGEPFEALIRKRKYLPNVVSRFCTIELKVRTAKRYLRYSWLDPLDQLRRFPG